MSVNIIIDPKLDLVFERKTEISVEKLWQGWTDPKTLMKWFCPKPWKVIDCRIELFAGGEFFNVMEGPNGEKIENYGCYLEVVEHHKLVWTGMMKKGFRPALPQAPSDYYFPFVATILFNKTDKGSLYKAIVAHANEEGRRKHEAMHFEEGWGAAFDQLVELMKVR